MYSAVIMMAMASAPDTASFGWRWNSCFGCSGCYGARTSVGCWGGCHGIWHGWGWRSGCTGCWGSSYSSCYGCTGYSSCYGCTGYSSCYGCTGCSSCYGCGGFTPSYGCGTYSSSYGCGTYSSSYGCGTYSSGYGCGTYTPSYGCGISYSSPITISDHGGYASPVTTSPISGYEAPTTIIPSGGEIAEVSIRVPADAKLYADGQLTALSGTQRNFVTPSLDKNREYNYTLKVEYVRDGKPVVETKQAVVRAGAKVVVDFNESASTELVASKVTVNLPTDAQLYVDNQRKSVPASGEFRTPELVKGQTYAYEFRVERMANGIKQADNKRVVFKAGETVVVDFSGMNDGIRTASK